MYENTKFCTKKLESTLARVGKNSVFEYLLFEMPLGRPQNIKLMNIGLQGRAGIIYLNIFYLKWLWQGMKAPSFAQNWRICTGRGGQEYYIWISSSWNAFGKAWIHRVLHIKLENLGFQGWAGLMFLNVWNVFGNASKYPVLHIKVANLRFQGWAGII